MATLHMDVDTCESTQRNMVSQHDQMKSAIDNLTTSVNSTVGSAWMGNSATEFQSLYDDLQRRVNMNVQELEQLAVRLQNEITEWVNAAQKLT